MAGASSLPTVADLINEALAHLGVYAPGDALQAADQASAYFTLQGIVDGYGAQACLIFDRTTFASFVATAGKSQYSVGTANTNDWMTNYLPPTFDLLTCKVGNIELPVEVITADKWAAIGLKSIQSNILAKCWPDYGATSHALNFYPTPSASIPVTMYLDAPIARFTGTSNVVALPPGFQELLTFELAIKCSSKFGATIPAWLPSAYEEVRANVKASNFEAIDLRCDDALVSRGGAGAGSLDFYLGR